MATEPVSVSAIVPAKLNLGLAIVGRRDDGFHELVTIMQAITLCDRLTLSGNREAGPVAQVALSAVTSANGVAIDDPGLQAGENLAVRAVEATLGALRGEGTYRLALVKGIPAASGMGGASADAAAAILATERIAGTGLPNEERLRLAAALGSDVPFFLTGGTALVTGRGEHIVELPAAGRTSLIVVFPRLRTPIPRKTARLFAALLREDFDDGDAVRHQALRLTAGLALDPDLLRNGFSRALAGLAPELATLRQTIETITGRTVALSGAGPTHYVVEPDPDRADRSVARLRSALGNSTLVARCEPWVGPPVIEVVDTPVT